jgi:hypothetical protein
VVVVTSLSPGRVSSAVRQPTLAADETTYAAHDRLGPRVGNLNQLELIYRWAGNDETDSAGSKLQGMHATEERLSLWAMRDRAMRDEIRAVQISGLTCFLTMQPVDCLEESLAEQNQVASVDRLLSKWQRVSSCVDERRARV